MANKQYLDYEGVSTLAEKILEAVNTRITERIIQDITDSTASDRIPSAVAVLNAISKMNHVSLKVIEGSIKDMNKVDIKPNVIYLQRDDGEDNTWTMYIYDEDLEDWIDIGGVDSALDLDDYWAKDDIEDLKSSLEEEGVPTESIDGTTIEEIVQNAMNETKNTLTSDKKEAPAIIMAESNPFDKQSDGSYKCLLNFDISEENNTVEHNNFTVMFGASDLQKDQYPQDIEWDIEYTDFKIKPSIFTVEKGKVHEKYDGVIITVSAEDAHYLDEKNTDDVIGILYIRIKSSNYHDIIWANQLELGKKEAAE